MDFMPGELVETKGGRIGRVIYSFRMTAYVGFLRIGADEFVGGFLASELCKIDADDRRVTRGNLPRPLAELHETLSDHYHSAMHALD